MIDLPFVSLLSAFFLEVFQPGWIGKRTVVAAFSLQALFIPVYLLYPVEWVWRSAYVVAFSIAWLTVLWVIQRYVTYRKQEEPPSAIRSLFNLRSMCWACLLYFASLYIYYVCFEEATWGSKVFFNAAIFLFWILPYRYSLRVIQTLQLDQIQKERETESADESSAEPAMVSGEPSSDGLLSSIQLEEIGLLLQQCMKQEKLFLNPKLTIPELASHLDTNKTYISFYLNRVKRITFHEYLNQLRVEEACARIDTMLQQQKRKPLMAISEESGFNSFSTFNRAFSRIKGVTPGDYVRQRQISL